MFTHNQIIRTLKDWGSNEGDLEEIMKKLLEDDDCYILSAEAEIGISYTLTLGKESVNLYDAWRKNRGRMGSIGMKEALFSGLFLFLIRSRCRYTWHHCVEGETMMLVDRKYAKSLNIEANFQEERR